MKRRELTIALGVFLLLAACWYFFFYANRFPKYNWDPRLIPAKNEPFGTELFSDYLVHNVQGFPVKKLESYSIPFLKLRETGSAFVLASNYQPGLSYDDRKELMQFLEEGGRVVLFCPVLGRLENELLKEEAREIISLRPEPVTRVGARESVPFTLAGNTAGFSYFNPSPIPDSASMFTYLHFRLNQEWKYVQQPPLIRGYAGSQPNLIEIPVGKGKILWHCQPQMLGNYFMKKKEVRAYLDQLFALAMQGKLGDKRNIYFAVSYYASEESDSTGTNNSPLRYILSVPAFRWAWYILLLGTLVWFLFLAKRRQRIIPLIPEKTNSSLHFIRAISELYFRRQNHYFICQQKMKVFLSHVRSRYGLNIQQFNAEMVDILARRSGCSADLIKDIIQDWNYIQEFSMESTSAEQLARFHSLTEAFYNQTASR